MPRGGHNKKHATPRVGPAALTRWPPPPKGFDRAEVASWNRLGEAAMALGSVGASDLMIAERAAQLDAKVTAAIADPDTNPTALVSLMRLLADYLNRMGLTPQARNTIGPLSKPKQASPLDEF